MICEKNKISEKYKKDQFRSIVKRNDFRNGTPLDGWKQHLSFVKGGNRVINTQQKGSISRFSTEETSVEELRIKEE